MNEHKETQSKPETGLPLGAAPWLGISKLDFFAAHALQGLLASGQYTEETGDGLWAKLEQDAVRDEDGNETGRKRAYSPAVELAWRMAEWMVRDMPNAEVEARREKASESTTD